MLSKLLTSLPPCQELNLTKLDIGVCPDEKTFFPMRTFDNSDSLKAVVDVRNRALSIFFDVKIRQSMSKHKSIAAPPSLFRIRVKFFELSKIWETRHDDTNEQSYFIFLDAPAVFHRQASTTVFNSEIIWRASDTWYRQTSVVHNPLSQANITTNLRKSGQIIDTGESSKSNPILPKLTSFVLCRSVECIQDYVLPR